MFLLDAVERAPGNNTQHKHKDTNPNLLAMPGSEKGRPDMTSPRISALFTLLALSGCYPELAFTDKVFDTGVIDIGGDTGDTAVQCQFNADNDGDGFAHGDLDTDGDNFGDETGQVAVWDDCGKDLSSGSFHQVTGELAAETDCDDEDSLIHPDAEEICDTVDNDCDGEADNDATDSKAWYADNDGDGFGAEAGDPMYACDASEGWSVSNADCDDTDASINDDATEICDGIDNDCDGLVDDEDSSIDSDSQTTWYVDDDGDTYGDADSGTQQACEEPTGYSVNSTDCDDADYYINPGVAEDCSNDVDDDCDGNIDATEWRYDGDGDGFPDPDVTSTECAAPTDYVDPDLDSDGNIDADEEDCDDADATSYPYADEYCDGTDHDCDGDVNEYDSVDASTWYLDSDGDGYGNDSASTASCSGPSGYEPVGGDCDDTDSSINPGATEGVGDEVDSDCDGAEECYSDDDGDTYGSTSTSASTDIDCGDSGEATNDEDCDDTDSSIYPGAVEHCDDEDEDCDGVIDNDTIDGDTYYADADADGYCDPDESIVACSGDEPSGTVPEADCDVDGGGTFDADEEDCEDDISFVNPGESANPYSAWDADCDGNWDRAGKTVSTDAGSFTYDSAAVNLFGDEVGDSTFEYGSTNWGVYVSSYGLTTVTVSDVTFTSYPSADTYPTVELLNPSSGSGIDNEALISTGFSVTSGLDYAVCVVVVNDGVDNQGMRLWTATEYDAGGDYLGNWTVVAGTENYYCGAWTAGSTTTEYIVVASGNWTSTAGAFTHIAVGEGSL
ncbi:hypothetical protein HON52_01555 [Candidatus Uhrbacteria bacterium]|nr:hypothetical protein [Candidatus Uhrbacteria bacterium]